jgi:hypothetical protein
MARWKLLAGHYLNVSGDHAVTWEYKETNRNTGKQEMKRFPVPMYLNPNESSDQNYRDNFGEGEIIVSNGDNPGPKDYIFSGPPTPDMLPLDEDAKRISASYADRWKHPIESLPGTYSQSVLNRLESELAEATSKTTQNIPGMPEFMATMAKSQEQNAAILAKLVEAVASPRRV